MRLLITGGAGFIGSTLALYLRRRGIASEVYCMDNLSRRGSERNIVRLHEAGARFVHGDARFLRELEGLPACDVIIHACSDPAVTSALTRGSRHVIESNLLTTVNVAEFAAQSGAALLLLSTSRVYPFTSLNSLPFEEDETRFVWRDNDSISGYSTHGISEAFTTMGPRSMYGATKLASEIVVAEYAEQFGLRTLINRCGVVAGPWQMGMSTQGIVAYWVANHVCGQPLRYLGFGGVGKQVRDVLHVDDLANLIGLQLDDLDGWSGETFNVGGGRANSVSLCELTEICEQETGGRVEIRHTDAERAQDVRIYYTDHRLVSERFDWQPDRDVRTTVRDIRRWLIEDPALLSHHA